MIGPFSGKRTGGGVSMRWRPANLRALAVTAGFAVVVVALFALAGLEKLGRGSGQPASAGSVLVSQGMPRADCTGLIAAVPPDDVPVLAALVAQYDSAGRTVEGKCVDVRILPKSAGEAADALGRGWDGKLDGPLPQVWLPGATSWVVLLRARASGKAASVLPDSSPSFAQSPFVVAMPRPMAEALGWPAKDIGFTDLVRIGVDPAGWGKVGHPEWGALRLGKTSPLISTSGLHALIAAYFAATGISADLTLANLTNPKVIAFVKGVELATVHYGDSTSTFLHNLQRADDAGTSLSYVSAVALEERQVLAYNAGNPTGDPSLAASHAAPKVQLAAIYPKEGTLISDNPFVVLNGTWVSPTQKSAAADLLSFLLAPEQQRYLQEAGYRDAQGRAGQRIAPVNGLLPDHPKAVIKPPPSSVLDKLQASWWQIRKPARVLVIVDVSGSMDDSVPGTGTTKLGLVKVALLATLDQIGDADQVGLWIFSDQHHEVVPIGRVGTQRARLKSAVGDMTAGGGTLLYSSVRAGLDFMKMQLDATSITAIVVLTDGADTNSPPAALHDLINAESSQPAEASVRVFTIAYGVDADRDVLRQIAEASQASSYDASNPALIRQVFIAVLSNF
jgi:Ca-activated chloride channel homolog